MLNLTYTYTAPEKIFKDIIFFKDFDTTWYIIIFTSLFLWILVIIYILPSLYIIKEQYIKQKEKWRKKLLLKQILMQKELEDQILKEVKKHS